MVHFSEINFVSEIFSIKATGISHFLRSLNTFEVVVLENTALPLIISCFAPSPAVRSSLDSITTYSGISV